MVNKYKRIFSIVGIGLSLAIASDAALGCRMQSSAGATSYQHLRQIGKQNIQSYINAASESFESPTREEGAQERGSKYCLENLMKWIRKSALDDSANAITKEILRYTVVQELMGEFAEQHPILILNLQAELKELKITVSLRAKKLQEESLEQAQWMFNQANGSVETTAMLTGMMAAIATYNSFRKGAELIITGTSKWARRSLTPIAIVTNMIFFFWVEDVALAIGVLDDFFIVSMQEELALDMQRLRAQKRRLDGIERRSVLPPWQQNKLAAQQRTLAAQQRRLVKEMVENTIKLAILQEYDFLQQVLEVVKKEQLDNSGPAPIKELLKEYPDAFRQHYPSDFGVGLIESVFEQLKSAAPQNSSFLLVPLVDYLKLRNSLIVLMKQAVKND